eukprot:TRINITY_DN7604_c1_g1_i1.p1 TRINITY_DN7604_c1_g1~~TRINITY_DN7604_c1_g1_i1.p1  ORF type:complete len:672 (+),score=107.88 TRINITY_DN7604_c1_g1_i1:36-2051(+)
MCSDLQLYVSASSGATYEQILLSEGVKAWSDADDTLLNVPAQLLGGSLLQGPFQTDAETSLSISVEGADARIYVAIEIAGPTVGAVPRHGGIARYLASDKRWHAEDNGPSWGNCSSEMALFSTLALAGSTGAEVTVSLPRLQEDNCVLILAAVPVVTGTFAVSIASNAGPVLDERLVVVEEGVIAWKDRDHQYFDIPEGLLGGAMFQGPHKEVPDGTIFTVRPNLQSRVYVVSERASSGGFVDSLPKAGWFQEDSAPRWHDTPTMVMFSRTCPAGHSITLPATRGHGTVFSIVAVPSGEPHESPLEITCTLSSEDVQAPYCDLLPLSEGVGAFNDGDAKFCNVPLWMCGATMARMPQAGPPAGTIASVRAAAASVVYAIVESENEGGSPGRHGGILPLLQAAGWERRDEAPKLQEGGTLAVFAKRVGARSSLSLPAFAEDGAVFALVVKVDMEAFGATLVASTGFEYPQAKMVETAQAWSDRPNRWAWLPPAMVDGLFFRGPFDALQPGTSLRVQASGPSRAYVIVEGEYKGKAARDGGFQKALPAAGWRLEDGNGPSWGDSNSKMIIYSRRLEQGRQLTLPAVASDIVFCVVIVNIADNPERLVEEFKSSFRLWDKEGKGGISRKDLGNMLQLLCPGLDGVACEAILQHADANGTGRISHEAFAASLLQA